MPIQNNWRIYCETEAAHVFDPLWVEEAKPTECPHSAAHVIDQDATVISSFAHIPGDRDPTEDDDESLGYVAGDHWINESSGREFSLLDASEGAAKWTTAKAPEYAIVAPSGGDYTSIAAAFNGGATSVFVHPGTYIETSDINVPEDGSLKGPCPGAVKLVLAAGAKLKVDGSGRRETTGTVSVASGSTAVTGSGTTFTNLVDGDWLQLGDSFFKINSITNDTSLTLEETYQGDAVSDQAFVGQSMLYGAQLEDLVIVGQGGGENVHIEQGLNILFRGMLLYMCGGTTTPAFYGKNCSVLMGLAFVVDSALERGIHLEGCTVSTFQGCLYKNSVSCGVCISDSTSITFDASFSIHNGNNGFNALAGCDLLQLNDCTATWNKAKGINVESEASRVNVSDGFYSHNASNGIDYDGSHCVVSGSSITNNGADGVSGGDEGVIANCYITDNGGVGIACSNDSDCAISACIVHHNGSHGITTGPGNVVQGCSVRDNVGDGIQVATDNVVVNGCRCSGNADYGVQITNPADDTIVTSCNLKGNTTGALLDNGTGTLTANNKT